MSAVMSPRARASKKAAATFQKLRAATSSG
jgi:hypothetical protein